MSATGSVTVWVVSSGDVSAARRGPFARFFATEAEAEAAARSTPVRHEDGRGPDVEEHDLESVLAGDDLLAQDARDLMAGRSHDGYQSRAYRIQSVKGTATITGTSADAIRAAWAHYEEYQPAYGVAIERVDD